MRKNKIGIILFLIPAVAVFLFVFLQSIIMLVGNSFTDYVGIHKTFNAGVNFINIWKDETFRKAALNTVKWVLIQSTIHLALGTGVALILSRKKWYWKFVRTVYMIPNMVAAAALGVIFVNMCNPQFGFINKAIQLLIGRECDINWFQSKDWSFFAVTMTWLPYAAIVTVLVLAEISAIDKSQFEAASVDGANEWQQIRFITLPNLRNIAGTCCIISATSMLQKFDIIYMATKGGPDDMTMNVPMYIYNTMKYTEYGMSSTAGVYLIVFGLICIVTIKSIFKIGKAD